MHKSFLLPVIEFPLSEEVPTASEESSHYQKKRDATAEKIALLLKSSSKCQSKSYNSYAKSYSSKEHQVVSELEMDQQNLTLAKIPILDKGKFEQWQFRIQQYLQHEYYALLEVIEFGDSYEAPKDNVTTGSVSDGTGKMKGRTVTLTTDDMQKRKNDVKARTTLLLALPDEHQLQFSKHKTAQELWAAIQKRFDGNEATKKTKNNLLKQPYGNFKAEGSETLEQIFNRLHVIRNKSDLDTTSLDDLYNHLKVYESKVQKKSESDSQNMAFISSAKHISGNEEVNTTSVSTASTNVSTACANIGAASISQDTAWKKITIQGIHVAGFDKSKVKCFNYHKMGHFARECRAPRSQDRGRRDNYRQGSKVEEQTPIGNKMHKAFPLPGEFPSIHTSHSLFNSQKEMDHQYPKVAKIPVLDTQKFEQWQIRIQQYLQHEHYALWERKKNDVKARTTLLLSLPDEHQLRFSKYKTAKELWVAILKTFGVWRNMNDLDTMSLDDLYNHLKVYEAEVQKKSNLNSQNIAFISSSKNSSGNEDDVAQLEGRLVEYKEREVKYIEKIRTLEMYRASNLKCIKTLDKELEELKLEKDGLDGKLVGLLKASKNLDNLIESQRSNKIKEGVRYNAVPPPAADLYLSPKKDLSWTGVPEFVDDTVTDYSRPSPTVASTSAEGQNKDSSTSVDVASPNTPKPFVKFVKPKDSQSESPEFVLNKKACFNCGDFSHLPNDCRKRVQREKTRSQKHAYKSSSHRSGGHRPHGAPIRPPHRSAGHKPHGASIRPLHRPAGHRPHGPSMNLMRSNMNSARPNISFFIQAHSYENRHFLKSSVVKTQYRAPWGSSQNNIDDKGYWDSSCSRHMTGNISYLSDFEPFNGGYVSFGQGG
nr:hypothetical protein [Tanacetum cinerariifolium]